MIRHYVRKALIAAGLLAAWALRITVEKLRTDPCSRKLALSTLKSTPERRAATRGSRGSARRWISGRVEAALCAWG